MGSDFRGTYFGLRVIHVQRNRKSYSSLPKICLGQAVAGFYVAARSVVSLLRRNLKSRHASFQATFGVLRCFQDLHFKKLGRLRKEEV